jgi:hypothetical protein
VSSTWRKHGETWLWRQTSKGDVTLVPLSLFQAAELLLWLAPVGFKCLKKGQEGKNSLDDIIKLRMSRPGNFFLLVLS